MVEGGREVSREEIEEACSAEVLVLADEVRE